MSSNLGQLWKCSGREEGDRVNANADDDLRFVSKIRALLMKLDTELAIFETAVVAGTPKAMTWIGEIGVVLSTRNRWAPVSDAEHKVITAGDEAVRSVQRVQMALEKHTESPSVEEALSTAARDLNEWDRRAKELNG
jgi:hypothetical protein